MRVKDVRLRYTGACLLLAMGMFSTVARAGPGVWTSGGPYGGYVFALAIDPVAPSTLYVGTRGGVFKSTNFGAAWASSDAGLTNRDIAALAINPSTPATLYVGTNGGGVFKSTDSGATWVGVNAGLTTLNTYALAINPAAPSTLYAGTYGSGVFKSIDSGGTWAEANTGLTNLRVHCLAINPSTPATIYAGTDGGVFRSNDSGTTWTAINRGLTSLFGQTLAINPSAPSTLYAGTGGGVFKSTDSGSTWAAANAGLTNLLVTALAINPANPATLYAGTLGGGIFKSTDSGSTWAISNAGVTSLSVYALAIDPSTPATLYAGTFGSGSSGVFRSTDSGGNWTAASTGLPGLYITALAINPSNPSTLYAGVGGGGIFKSTDSGGAWVAANTGLTNLNVNALVINPSTPSTLYAGTYGGVFKSTDSGGTWTAVNAGLTNLTIFALAINASNPTTLYAGVPGGGIFKSTDSGGVWVAANTGLTNLYVSAVAIDPSTSSTLYAGTNDGVFKSTDSGSAWAAANTGLQNLLVQALVISSTIPTTLFAGTLGGGVLKSSDSGGTWAAVNGGLPSSFAFALALDPTGEGTLFAGLSGGSVWQLTPTNPTLIPIVLSSAGLSGSFFTSELALTNRGTSDVSMTYAYTAAFGGASGTASETLAAGTQKIVPDAIEYLRGLGIPVGESGNRGGTLQIDFSGVGAATVRTTTVVPQGRAGLAYGGLPSSGLLSAPVYLSGLRQNTFDRSNVAVVNAGTASDGPITLIVAVVSGDPAHYQVQTLPDITLSPGAFTQISGVLASNGLSLTNGYVGVSRVSGTAAFYAYGVINDQANSDGSFVEPVLASPSSAVARLTLPVIVETSVFTSELVVTNFSSSPRTLHCLYVAAALTGGQVSFDISLLSNEQQILPAIVQLLRDRGTIHDPPGGTFVGALFVTDATEDLRGVSVAARTLTPGGGGRYGLFYAAVPAGSEATTAAWLYGLQQNAENRTNLALVNVGSADGSADTFRIDLFDGASGQKAGTTTVTVPAKGFVQFNTILSQYAPSVTNGYALVTRTSGNNPFIAYAVINDGGNPGERTGDGAFVKAEVVP